MIHDRYILQLQNRWLMYFIISSLKLLAIPAIWLARSSVIYSQIAPFFCSKSHLFPSQWKRHTKAAQPKRFQISFKVTNQIAGKMYVIIKSGNWSSCRAILIWNHTCDFETNSRCTLVQFWNQAYDFRPNCTPLSWITIINEHASRNFLGWLVLRNFFYLSDRCRCDRYDRWKLASIAISQRS